MAEARAAGFEHVNLDLIYGTPGETDADWQASLDAAIGSGADHVSAYALIVEDGTALARKVASGAVPAPDDDVLADRYLQADDALAAAGFGWYEVSNWARTPAGPVPAQPAVLVRGELVGGRAPARTATSAAPGGGTSSTPPATPRRWTPAAARRPAGRRWTTGTG